MKLEYDDAKNLRNIIERNLPFSMVEDFNFESALIKIDQRYSNEARLKAVGKIGQRLYVLVYTMRELKIRVISFRKANKREIRDYEAEPLSH